MTYCVAMLLDAGLVFLSDSRTNAGVDQINTFRKTTVFERPGDRVIVLSASGNLAVDPGRTLNLLARARSRTRKASFANLYSCRRTCSRPARCVGDALREMHMHARDGEALRLQGVEFNPCVHHRRADQRRGAAPVPRSTPPATSSRPRPTRRTSRSANRSTASPIIDRVDPAQHAAERSGQVRADLDGLRPIRSNLLGRARRSTSWSCVATSTASRCHVDIDADNRYFQMIRNGWGEALREAFSALPNPDWLGLVDTSSRARPESATRQRRRRR